MKPTSIQITQSALRKCLRAGTSLMAWLCISTALQAEVGVSRLFTDHMVLQRNKPVPVFGTAAAAEKVTVAFGGQTLTTTADARGAWQVMLPAMNANANGQPMTLAASNTIAIQDVVIGDVWLCSGQSNMDMRLDGCNRKEDVASADFPGIRNLESKGWSVCQPGSAGHISGTAFYFARKIYQETDGKIPIALMLASVGGSPIDLWLAPEGLVGIPVLDPLWREPAKTPEVFNFFHGFVHPLVPYGIKGAIWYQGENAERRVLSPDSYFLKMKALVEGWKRVWGMDDFPFYYVMIANYGLPLKTETPVLVSGGWDADTRLQQANAMVLPHAGCASAIDIGVSKESWDGYHPANKLDVGERLALWALKNDYGRADLVTSGPTLRDVVLSGNTVVCTFDHIGKGLMVGLKNWYQPTQELPDGKLQRFVIAGVDNKWHAANAVIKDNTVVLSSPEVAAPRKVSYACWQNPEGCNLYNKEGLPAAPFHVEDVTRHCNLAATAGPGGDITPAGTRRVLPRMTARYDIKAQAGHFIQDVKVDGVSVGSVSYYIFDPVDANHTIEATFTTKIPSYTIETSATAGGSLVPSGVLTVDQGASRTFQFDTRCRPAVTVDGVLLGTRYVHTFSDVRANHKISVAFNPIIKASGDVGGTIKPAGELALDYGKDQVFAIEANPGYAVAHLTVDGVDQGAKTSLALTNITANHTIAVTFAAKDGGVLLSQGKPTSASSVMNGRDSNAAVDGQINSQWVADGDAKPQWLKVDLGQDCIVTRCETYCEFPRNQYGYKIECSPDDKTWSLFADRQSNKLAGDPCYTDVAAPAPARYVRITITGSSGGYAAIWEFRIYGKPIMR
ncbi:MAG: discoidin domain-containing protein [Verrucomicrobia bacterium]|nr:discoidin domain-containing protein [Verrucomicrobiota bacterium]